MTAVFAQSPTIGSAEADSVYRINIRDLAELEIVTGKEYAPVNYLADSPIVVFRADTASTGKGIVRTEIR